MMSIVTDLKEWKRSNPLREWRTQNGVTIHEASSLLAVSMTTIQLWESGSAQPSDESMEKLTKLIGPNVKTRWHRWHGKNPGKNL